MSTTHTLLSHEGGVRLDRFVATRLPELSRSHVQKLIQEGHITVGGHGARPSLKLRPGDEVTVMVPEPVASELTPEPMPLTVVYEDADLLVVDKPAGLTVHPGPGHPSHTLVNAILARCPDLAGIKGTLRPGIVHRLDKDTSGLIIVAKNDSSQAALSQQIKDRAVTKRYQALVKGSLKLERQAIEGPIGRDPRNRKRMAIIPHGREARTECRVLRRLEGYTLVEATLVTGRTHQIRVHLSSIGHPVVGDQVYGGRSPLLGRQFLHAAELRFRQPRTSMPIECVSPLPSDLRAVLETLTKPPPSRARPGAG